LILHGIHPLGGVKQGRGGEDELFLSKMRQYHSPDGADGCCITSNKSLTCLQLVFTSNWSNFLHAFSSRSFDSVGWAFLFYLPTKTYAIVNCICGHTIRLRYLAFMCKELVLRNTD